MWTHQVIPYNLLKSPFVGLILGIIRPNSPSWQAKQYKGKGTFPTMMFACRRRAACWRALAGSRRHLGQQPAAADRNSN